MFWQTFLLEMILQCVYLCACTLTHILFLHLCMHTVITDVCTEPAESVQIRGLAWLLPEILRLIQRMLGEEFSPPQLYTGTVLILK